MIIRMRGLPYDCSAKQVVSIDGVLTVAETETFYLSD